MVEVWVICPDNGQEGLEAPIQAFMDEHTAKAALALLRDTYRAFRLVKVPVWLAAPAMPDTPDA